MCAAAQVQPNLRLKSDSTTQSAPRWALFHRTEHIKGLVPRASNLGFFGGLAPLSCWYMTHVTSVKLVNQYYSNASFGDITAGSTVLGVSTEFCGGAATYGDGSH